MELLFESEGEDHPVKIHQRNGGGPDNVHFTKKGYKALADLIADFIKEQMSNTLQEK